MASRSSRHATILPIMRTSKGVPRGRQARHPSPGRALILGARSGLLIFLAGTLVALAGTPPNLDEAIRQQRAQIATQPADAGSLNDLGNLLALAGDLEAAQEAYRQAIALAPENASSYYNLALILMEEGRRKEAHKTLRTVLELDPRHAWGHYQMGSLLEQNGDRSKAVHHYAEAFHLDRSLTSPKVNPHIVENHVATEALLKVYVDENASAYAPRIYEDPGRVAAMLLPAEPATPVAEPEIEVAPESTEDETIPQRRGPRIPAAATDGGTATSTSEADSDPVYSGGGETTATSVTLDDGEPTGPRPTDSGQIDSRSLRGDETGPSGEAGTGVDAEPTPSSSTAPDQYEQPSSRSYLPGVQSTGRLDIELFPAPEPAPAVSSR